MPSISSEQRYVLRELMRDVNDRKLAAQQAVTSWRNFTLAFCGVLVVTLPLLALILPHVGSGLVSIRATQDGAASVLSTGDLVAIELWGALGGLVGIIPAIGRLRLTSRPSSLQIAQLVLKPIAGGAVALFAIVLLQGGLIKQLSPVADNAIAAYAVLFGFAQEILTRAIDRRAGTLLDTAKPTREKTAGS